jgi:hypothetical protein
MSADSGQGHANRPADPPGAAGYHDYPLDLIKPHGCLLLINTRFSGVTGRYSSTLITARPL